MKITTTLPHLLSSFTLALTSIGLAAACATEIAGSQPPSCDFGQCDQGFTLEPDAGMPGLDEDTDADLRADYEIVLASFGTIETIAGTAQIEGKEDNGWQESFEGGSALDAELSRPHMAQADSSGRIYIADKDAHAIRMVDLDGSISTFAGTSRTGDDGDGPGQADEMRLASPNGLWVASTGIVYVYDLGNEKVRRVEDGVMETLFEVGASGSGRGLWVADDESLAYMAAGSELKKWTPETGIEVLASGFESLGNFFVQQDGDLLVTDRHGHRAYRITSQGDKTVIAGTGERNGASEGQLATEAGLDQVRGIWEEPSVGGFFLATHKGGRIWYVGADGRLRLVVDGDQDGSHAGDGLAFDDPEVRISEPRAITLDRQGNLLITEHDGGYIRRVNRR